MANIKIAIINQSTVVTDADAQNVTTALQTQVTRDFAPVWGVDAQLSFFGKSDPVPAHYWWLIILDNSDQAGALGYHDLTNEGLPLGKVFAKSDLQYGYQWSVTASHELLEMLGDPDINLCAFVQKGNTAGTLYAYEVCDACEADQFGYKIGNVLVSDFVHPEWFEDMKHVAGTQYDHQKKISKPFQLSKGGYISIYKINGGQGWTQLHAEQEPLEYNMRAKVGTRRERRRTQREQWQTSKAEHGLQKISKPVILMEQKEDTAETLTVTLVVTFRNVDADLSHFVAECNGVKKEIRETDNIVFEDVSHEDVILVSGSSAGDTTVDVKGAEADPSNLSFTKNDMIIGTIQIL